MLYFFHNFQFTTMKYIYPLFCRCLQGDMFQTERNEIITAFKKQEFPVLVATDVAARGLDIPHIRTVINFDVARDIDTHTHRVGRTGRAGIKGEAYTLVTANDKEFAGHIVRLDCRHREPLEMPFADNFHLSRKDQNDPFKCGGSL